MVNSTQSAIGCVNRRCFEITIKGSSFLLHFTQMWSDSSNSFLGHRAKIPSSYANLLSSSETNMVYLYHSDLLIQASKIEDFLTPWKTTRAHLGIEPSTFVFFMWCPIGTTVPAILRAFVIDAQFLLMKSTLPYSIGASVYGILRYMYFWVT